MRYRIRAVPSHYWPNFTPGIREFEAPSDMAAIELASNLDSSQHWQYPLRFVDPHGGATCSASPRLLTEIPNGRIVKQW